MVGDNLSSVNRAIPPWSLSSTFENAAETQVNLVRSLLEVSTWLLVVPGLYCIVGGWLPGGIWVYSRRKSKP